MIRQAAGPNDHPTTSTFLHLYKILSVYSVLKPPKYRNCTVNISDTPRITMADLHTIFHDKITERFEKISKLKTKFDQLICDGLWDQCDVFPSIECDSEESIQEIVLFTTYVSMFQEKFSSGKNVLNA